MIDFAPNSPWPRRIKMGLIALAVIVVFQAIAGMFARRWVKAAGGEYAFVTGSKIKGIEAGIAAHHFIKRRYPTQEEGIESLYKGKRRLPLVFSKQNAEDPTLDAWGRKFQYLVPGKHNTGSYDLWSLGEDGANGTDDDITNWQVESP